MALNSAFHFSLMQVTVMSDVHKLLRMKNSNEKEYCTEEKKKKDNKDSKHVFALID